jgi:carbamoyl-phosphate synthase large subunit
MANDPGYIDAIEEICTHERIGLVVPTIDDELPLFGAWRDRLQANGTRVAASSQLTAEICNDKFLTCHYLASQGIPVADTFLPSALPSDLALPVFVKPRVGRGGVGAFAARTRRELEFFIDYVPTPVVQTFLDGPEFTIDVLGDFDGRPMSVVPRERVVIRAGTIDRGRTVSDRSLLELGIRCAQTLRFVGAANVQCRVVDGQPVVFEINPRFSGGIPLTIAAGANFPRLLVELALGREVEDQIGSFESGLWMTNFETMIVLRADAAQQLEPYRPVALREAG